ncbi:uncharacterized protein LOC116252294 [Nymphaea colorata]|nr:uncharacterized protein LOC116252294 [Nymphaea colorata]
MASPALSLLLHPHHHLHRHSFGVSTSLLLTSPASISVPRSRSRRTPTSPLTKKGTRRRASPAVAQVDVLRVISTAWRVGKEGIEAGIKFVPDSVPRPVARVGVGGLALMVTLFVLKSFISTAFFVLAMMGFIYFVFLAVNKGDGSSGGGGGGGEQSTDDALEEARRIMEKYK